MQEPPKPHAWLGKYYTSEPHPNQRQDSLKDTQTLAIPLCQPNVQPLVQGSAQICF